MEEDIKLPHSNLKEKKPDFKDITERLKKVSTEELLQASGRMYLNNIRAMREKQTPVPVFRARTHRDFEDLLSIRLKEDSDI